MNVSAYWDQMELEKPPLWVSSQEKSGEVWKYKMTTVSKFVVNMTVFFLKSVLYIIIIFAVFFDVCFGHLVSKLFFCFRKKRLQQTNRNPSAGKVSIFGHNMSMESERVKAFDLLGVCPQVDPLWESLAAKNLEKKLCTLVL